MGSRHPLPYAFAKANTLLLEDDGRELTLWAGEHASPAALSEVTRVYGVQRFEREPVATLAQRIQAAYAGGESSAAAVVGEVESAVDLSRMMQDLPAVEDLLEAANDAPIIRMLNALLTQAAKDGASDIHFEPFETEFKIRYRVDGTLPDVAAAAAPRAAAVISRVKVMANLNIAEGRLPQDGRIQMTLGGPPRSICASRPCPRPVRRVESCSACSIQLGGGKLELETLGMPAYLPILFNYLLHTIEKPNGIFIVAGPTGSGKTTTLYACLNKIATGEVEGPSPHEEPREYERSRTIVRVPDERRHRAGLRPRHCAPFSARTRTASWWVKRATWRPRRSPSRRRSPATSSSPRCTPTTPPRRRHPPHRHGRRAVHDFPLARSRACSGSA